MPQYNAPALVTTMAASDILLVWKSAAAANKTILFSDFAIALQTYIAGGTGLPGGLATQVQFNNAGAFGGITGATTNGTILTLTSPAITTPTGIVKGDVGLGNVDNTTDVNKPISTATQTALNLLAPIAGPTFTGVASGVTAAPGTNTTQLATTAFVTAAVAASGAGTVTAVSVVSANGFNATVTNPTTNPGITIKTTITGILSGDGTAISAAAQTGSGSVVRATNPIITGPTIAALPNLNSNGFVKTGGGVGTLTVDANITLASMANLAANSIIGNNTGSPATPLALSVSQTKTLLAIAQADVAGLTTASSPSFNQITSTVVTGTAPLVVASTTVVANLNASYLGGYNWTTPGAIGGSVPNSGSFTTLNTTGDISAYSSAATKPQLTIANDTNDVNASYLIFYKDRGGSHGITGDTLGTIAWATVDNTDNYKISARIYSTAFLIGATYVQGAVKVDTMDTAGTSATRLTITSAGTTATGSMLSSSATAGIGYTTGAGGSVTQLTTKSTGVTLNTATGQITLSNASLGGNTSVSFTFTNSAIGANDIPVFAIKSGATVGNYYIQIDAVTSGACTVTLRNDTGGSLSEAVVLQYYIAKGSIT